MSRHFFFFLSFIFSLFDFIVFSVSLNFPSQLKVYWFLPPCWGLPSITFYSSISTAIIQGLPVVAGMSNVSHGLRIWIFGSQLVALLGEVVQPGWRKSLGVGFGVDFWGGLWEAHTASSHFPLLGVCGWRCDLGLLLPQLAAMPLPTLVGCPSGIRSENKPSCVHCPWSSQQQGRNPSTSSASLLRSSGSCQFLRLRLPFLGFLSSLVRAYH